MSTYCRILIVEDEYLTRQGIKGMIHWEQEGFPVSYTHLTLPTT